MNQFELGLKNVISKKRYTNERSVLGYFKFDKPILNKPTFVKSNNAFNNEQPKKVQNNFQPRKTYVKYTSYTSIRNESLNKYSCFYCNCERDTHNTVGN